jgi:DNA-binding transcriptional MerR regulator/methylmalonyl-CoA mutase cobalamin-binding subunit
MQRFSMQMVAEKTGLTAHVIRVWEKRYAAVEPNRTNGGHRWYGEDHVMRLSLLANAVRLGHAIGRVAELSNPDIERLIAAGPRIGRPNRRSVEALRTALEDARQARHAPVAPPQSDAENLKAELLRATQDFDDRALSAAFRECRIRLGDHGMLVRVLAPLTAELGELWRRGEISAAKEHFFTAGLKVFVGTLTRQYSAPVDAPRIVFATPAGQLHELGAIMAAAAAANIGWNVLYLGPSLPAADLASAVRQHRASVLALSVVYPEDDNRLPIELAELKKMLPIATRVLLGGRAAPAYRNAIESINATLVTDGLDGLTSELEAIRAGKRPLQPLRTATDTRAAAHAAAPPVPPHSSRSARPSTRSRAPRNR